MPRRPNPHVARPACPEHPGSRVRFDGTYGKAPHKRQRYECVPLDGAKPHVFTELLPRQRTASGECLHCERHIAPHEGPPTPRGFRFSTRDIAAALVAVGQGVSYSRAGFDVRRAAGRHANQDARLIGDWIELFAPVVFAPYAPTKWPRHLVLDALPFRIRAKDEYGQPKQGGAPAFTILAAYGYPRVGEPGEMLALEAVPGRWFGHGHGDWEAFLGSLDRRLAGAPLQIVTDIEAGLHRAIARVWPGAQLGLPTLLPGAPPLVWLCHWHLKQSLRNVVRGHGVGPGDALYDAIEDALHTPAHWSAFVQQARGRRLRRLTNWLRRYDARIAWQVANQRHFVAGSGGLENALNQLRHWLDDRRGLMLNRERLNRLLMLMQLELNGIADEVRYAQLIREHLTRRDGRAGRRQAIKDASGSPSLRA